jgi:transposase
MNQNEKERLRARLKWISLYENMKNAGLVCRRCGISHPTLRKWLKRYAGNGLSDLKDQSRRPLNISNQKVLKDQEKLILDLRLNRKFGVKRIQSELNGYTNYCYIRVAHTHAYFRFSKIFSKGFMGEKFFRTMKNTLPH